MDNIGCPTFEFTITMVMVMVMETLKDQRFFVKMSKVRKDLDSKKHLVIDIIEFFDNTLSPGFSLWDKNNFNP